MSTGQRIKTIRDFRKLKQKELGVKLGFPENRAEVRMSQYENDKRKPKSDMVEKMAFYLDVNELAISEATVDSRLGAMHLLFIMEELYGVHPEMIDDKVVLTVDNTLSSDIYEDINHWLEYYQKFINNEISEEEYRNFKYQYPKAIAYNTKDKKSND